MIEDTGTEAAVPLPNVSSKILSKVIEYCNYHVESRKQEDDKPKHSEDEVKAWDAEFVKVDQGTLFELILVWSMLPWPLLPLFELACPGWGPCYPMLSSFETQASSYLQA